MHNNLQTVDNGRALRVLVVTLGLTECSDVMKGASEDHFDISLSLGSIYDQTVGARRTNQDGLYGKTTYNSARMGSRQFVDVERSTGFDLARTLDGVKILY